MAYEPDANASTAVASTTPPTPWNLTESPWGQRERIDPSAPAQAQRKRVTSGTRGRDAARVLDALRRGLPMTISDPAAPVVGGAGISSSARAEIRARGKERGDRNAGSARAVALQPDGNARR